MAALVAAKMLGAVVRLARTAMQSWTPKSTAMPTNSTAKATEIRFSAPTASAAKAAVISSPTASVIMIAPVMAKERRASSSSPSTSTTDTVVDTPMPSLTLANWSSFSGMLPVWRTVTP